MVPGVLGMGDPSKQTEIYPANLQWEGFERKLLSCCFLLPGAVNSRVSNLTSALEDVAILLSLRLAF